MNKRAVYIFVILLFIFADIMPAEADKSRRVRWEKAKQEKQAKEEVEKQKVVADRQEKISTGNRVLLQKGLEKNTVMNTVQKKELIEYFDSQRKKDPLLNEKQSTQDVAVFEKIANDRTINQAQKKAAIKAYMEKKIKINMKEGKNAGNVR